MYNAELMFDERTGKIRVIMAPEHKGRIRFGGTHEYVHFPWDCVKNRRGYHHCRYDNLIDAAPSISALSENKLKKYII